MENLKEKQIKIKKNLLKYGIPEEKFDYDCALLANPFAWFFDKDYRIIFGKRAKLIKEEHTVITPSNLYALLKDFKNCRITEFEVYTIAFNDRSIQEKLSAVFRFNLGEEVYDFLIQKSEFKDGKLFQRSHNGEINAYHFFFSDGENKKLRFKDLEIIVESEAEKDISFEME